MSLTKGAVQAFQNGQKLEKPVLRISNMKKISSVNGPDKIRLILTDGVLSHSFVMLGAQLNDKVNKGEIVQDSIIRLDNYAIKTQSEKNIVMITELTVLSPNEIENLPPSVILDNKPTKPVVRAAQTSASNIGIVPINLLNPYQNKWSIKGRIIQKERIKTWSKPNNEGKLFSFTMADDSCDVRVTAFNSEVDRFHDLIEVDKTYILSRASVKVANRQFNSTKCDHEISLKSETEITEVVGEMEVPAMQYEFVDIAHIKDRNANTKVDIVGVAHEIKDTSTIITKSSNKEVIKRDIVLVDRSGSSINVTLWADDVKSVDDLVHPIVVIRGAVVSEFSGRSLNVANSSILRINPIDVPEASALLGWYQSVGHESRFESQSFGAGSFKPSKKALISELACSTDGDKGAFFTVKASIANIKKENLVYKSCEKCNKKMVDLHNGLYSCERCNIESPNFKYRLMINVNIIDHSGVAWATAFQESAEKILGVSADTIGQMIEQEDKESVEKIIAKVIYADEVNLRLRVTNDTYNDETRMKITLNDCSPIDIMEEIAALMV